MRVVSILAFGLSVLCISPSYAQMSNAPFTPTFQGGGAIGMSPAYRQAIVNQKLGTLSTPLFRDTAGNLVEVGRSGNLPLIDGTAGRRFAPTNGGLGYGPSAGTSRGPRIATIAVDGFGGYFAMGYPAPANIGWQPFAASPIDAWIALLRQRAT